LPKRRYSCKKKSRTQKAQVLADPKSAQVDATTFSYGSKRDFQLFKDDDSKFAERLHFLASAGHQGPAELHENYHQRQRLLVSSASIKTLTLRRFTRKKFHLTTHIIERNFTAFSKIVFHTGAFSPNHCYKRGGNKS
jgi:hypothetical protein